MTLIKTVTDVENYKQSCNDEDVLSIIGILTQNVVLRNSYRNRIKELEQIIKNLELIIKIDESELNYYRNKS